MKIAIAQINPTMGDFRYNLNLIKASLAKLEASADLVIFPELCISGYNPQDLALRDDFISICEKSIEELKDFSRNLKPHFIVGAIRRGNNRIFNSAFLLHNGDIKHIQDKISLPNYGVFDEKRIFSPGEEITLIEILGKKSLILICEDLWDKNIQQKAADLRPEYSFAINASPYSKTKLQQRKDIATNYVAQTGSMLFYSNQVGLQDSIIFDGSSFAMDNCGKTLHEAQAFEEDYPIIDTSIPYNHVARTDCARDANGEIYNALMFALRDYLRKHNMKKVIIGFSSGIDSALSSIIAMDAIGKENVHLVALPTRFSSKETHMDAKAFAHMNGVRIENIPIENLVKNAFSVLALGNKSSIVTQNLQSRIRGTILMALSNEHNALLLSTGNKSELAVGYATIYGDMNGGYNLLKDLYKTEVYELANWRNNNIPPRSQHMVKEPIVSNILTKAPTAELAEGQKDSDSLPEYDILDDILYNYINLSKSRDYIVSLGYKAEIVDQVLNLVRMSEFKRQQSTLGPKISDMSFDLDWRWPITNKFY